MVNERVLRLLRCVQCAVVRVSVRARVRHRVCRCFSSGRVGVIRCSACACARARARELAMSKVRRPKPVAIADFTR